MLDSTPVPLLAIGWPLVGAAVVLFTARFMPRWLCRLVALAAALASLAALWSLRTAANESLHLSWEPLNLFRLDPALRPDHLGLAVGITLVLCAAAALVGLDRARRLRQSWYGLLLVALSGCLIVTMAADLVAMVLGSALLDLALLTIALLGLEGPHATARPVWTPVVPGLASTFLLLLAAVWIDSRLGTASLQARAIPTEALLMIGVAGLLRALVLPLYPRQTHSPAGAIAAILTVGTGLYLLIRVQSLASVLSNWPWLLVIAGSSLVAGGLLVWASRAAADAASPAGAEKGGAWSGRTAWLGLVAHQVGLTLTAVTLLGTAAIWPLIGLALALSAVAIWWDNGLAEQPGPRPAWQAWIWARLAPAWARLRSLARERAPAVSRVSESRAVRRALALLPAIALASLVGLPLTAGAVARWACYATLLGGRQALLLLTLLVADAFLAAGIWIGLRAAYRQVTIRPPRAAALVAPAALALLLLLVGVAPGHMARLLELKTAALPPVSAWGLGLVYGLPWLLGFWLLLVTERLEGPLGWVYRILGLDWVQRPIAWLSGRVADGLYWLGRVGEGEGWWGWALIILALGTLFLANR